MLLWQVKIILKYLYTKFKSPIGGRKQSSRHVRPRLSQKVPFLSKGQIEKITFCLTSTLCLQYTRQYITMLFFHYICSSLPAQYQIVSTVFDTVFFKYTWSMTSCVLSLNTISTCTTNSMSYNDGNNLICVYFSLFFTLTLCIFFITNLTLLILSIHKMVYLFLVQLSLKMCSCGENIFRHWKTSWHLVYLIN